MQSLASEADQHQAAETVRGYSWKCGFKQPSASSPTAPCCLAIYEAMEQASPQFFAEEHILDEFPVALNQKLNQCHHKDQEAFLHHLDIPSLGGRWTDHCGTTGTVMALE